MYVCFECLPVRNMCNELRLYNHRAKFHRGQQSGFKCNLCTQKFLTPRKLRKHKKMSHVFTKTYQCHFCEELFISETAVHKYNDKYIYLFIVNIKIKRSPHMNEFTPELSNLSAKFVTSNAIDS
jgi:hypothetical protein